MTTFLGEVRETLRLLPAWRELYLGEDGAAPPLMVGSFVNERFHPLGHLQRFAGRTLLRSLAVAAALGAAVGLLIHVLDLCGVEVGEASRRLPPVTAGLLVTWLTAAAYLVGLLLCVVFAFGGRGLFPIPFEVLRLPSRRAWLAVCGGIALAALCGVGLVAAATFWVWLLSDLPRDLRGPMGVMVAVMPVFVGVSWGAILVGTRVQWLAKALVIFVFMAGWLLVLTCWHPNMPAEVAWGIDAGLLVSTGLLVVVTYRLASRNEAWVFARPTEAVIQSGELVSRTESGGRGVKARAPVSPWSWLRGRHGVLWAAAVHEWYWLRERWYVPGLLLVPAFGFLAQAVGGEEDPVGFIGSTGLERFNSERLAAILFAAWCMAFHPLRTLSFVLPPKEQLQYQLGLAIGDWWRFRWRTWWLSPLLFIAIAFVAFWGVTAERLGVLALAAGALFVRVAWCEHPLLFTPLSKRGSWVCVGLLGLFSFLATCYLLGPGADAVVGLVLLWCGAVVLSLLSGWRRYWLPFPFAAGAYGAYRLVSALPLVGSWVWLAAGAITFVALVGAIDQRLTCDEASLREWIRRHDVDGVPAPAPPP